MKSSKLASILQTQIEQLPFRKDIEFALNICIRLLPDYVSFYQNNEWGDPKKVKEAIDFCERNSSSLDIDMNQLSKIKEELDSVTPDTEGFGDWDGSYALNSSCAVLELLEYLQDRDKDHILNIGSYITDTINFKLSEENEDISDEQLKDHPQIIEELTYQIELTK
jgi:uncharacterized protein YjaG (DUF416 family)